MVSAAAVPTSQVADLYLGAIPDRAIVEGDLLDAVAYADIEELVLDRDALAGRGVGHDEIVAGLRELEVGSGNAGEPQRIDRLLVPLVSVMVSLPSPGDQI